MNGSGRNSRQETKFAGPRIGIDLGGTSIVGVLTGNDDEILHQSVIATGADQSVDTVIARIAGLALDLCEKAAFSIGDIRFAGIGVPGEVSTSDFSLRSSPILKDWRSVHVGDLLQEQLGNRWSVINDANAALLGEWTFGEGRGFDSIILLTIGTGIGGGVLVDGKLIQGLEGSAGEIGHISVDPGGVKCWCGNRGCLGVVASTTSLLADYCRSEQIPDLAHVDGEALTAAYHDGNRNALAAVQRMTENLAIGIRSALCVTSPQAVILAGGIVAGLGNEISTMVKHHLTAWRYPASLSRVTVRPAALTGVSGALGASIFGAE